MMRRAAWPADKVFWSVSTSEIDTTCQSMPPNTRSRHRAPHWPRNLGSDCVGDTLLGEARLGRTRELLLRRRTAAGLRGVALALLHETRQGRPGEFLARRLSLAGCLRRKRAGGRQAESQDRGDQAHTLSLLFAGSLASGMHGG